MSKTISQMIDDYIKLIEIRPDLFLMKDNIITNPQVLLKYSQSHNKEVGLVYESPWHYLLVDVVKDEEGNPKYAYERYVGASTSTGSVMIPILPDGRICLLQNYRHILGRTVFELPRGYAFDDEDKIETAARELAEELGAKASKAELIGYVIADSGITSDRIGIVKMDIEKTDVQIGHEGIKSYVALTRDEIDEMIHTGKLEDAFTLSALTLLESQKHL